MNDGCGRGEQAVEESHEEVGAFAEATTLCDVLASVMKLVTRRQNSLFLLLI